MNQSEVNIRESPHSPRLPFDHYLISVFQRQAGDNTKATITQANEAAAKVKPNGEFPNNIRANNIKTKLVSNNIKMK